MEDDPWADAPASPRPPSIHDSPAKPGPSPSGSQLAQREHPSLTSSSASSSPSSSPPPADTSLSARAAALDISFESTETSTSSTTDQPSQRDASSPGLGGQKSAAAGLESHEQSEQSSAQDGQPVEKPKPLSETPAIRDLPVEPNSEAQVDPSASAEEGFPASSASEQPTPIEGGDDFDDFDDFDDPQDSTTAAAAAGPSSSFAGDKFISASAASRIGGVGDDDGFGDFGDFEEGDFEEPAAIATNTGGVFPHADTAPEPERWVSMSPTLYEPHVCHGVMAECSELMGGQSALNLRPFPPKSELLQQVTGLLSPLQDSNAGFGQASGSGSNSNLNSSLTDEPVRMVGGLSQIMVAESRSVQSPTLRVIHSEVLQYHKGSSQGVEADQPQSRRLRPTDHCTDPQTLRLDAISRTQRSFDLDGCARQSRRGACGYSSSPLSSSQIAVVARSSGLACTDHRYRSRTPRNASLTSGRFSQDISSSTTAHHDR
jgi:hypothetical protein